MNQLKPSYLLLNKRGASYLLRTKRTSTLRTVIGYALRGCPLFRKFRNILIQTEIFGEWKARHD